jgi:plastocyanin
MSGTQGPVRSGLIGLCAVTVVACSSPGTTSASSSSGSSSSSSSSSSDAGSTASTITIKNFTFTTPDSVAAGATVTVDNQDGTLHTVTSDEGDAFDDSASAGTSSFTAPTKPGSYPFHCSVHPEMHGTLVVK